MIDDNLFDLANSNLYLQNPFRRLGLNADATLREIKKKHRILTLSKEMEIEKKEHLSSDINVNSIVNGGQSDPVQRLLHRIFWIWPEKKGKQSSAIPVDYFETAISYWERKLTGGRSSVIAMHNLAVINQLVFLELTESGRQFSELSMASGELENTCEQSLKYWACVVATKNFWQRVYNWVAEEDDPRLDVAFLKRLKAQLTSFICVIYLNAAEKMHNIDKFKMAKMVVDHLWNSELRDGALDSALAYQFNKTRNEVSSQASAYRKSLMGLRPSEADKLLREQIRSVKNKLVFADLVAPERSVFTTLADTVAAGFLNTIKTLDIGGKHLFLALHTLAEMKSIPMSSALSQRIGDEQKKLREILSNGNYWYTEKYFDTSQDVLVEMEEARKLFKSHRYSEAIKKLKDIQDDFEGFTIEETEALHLALSTTHYTYGNELVNKAFEVLQTPRPLHQAIKTHGRYSYSWSNECAACGGMIYGGHYNYEFEGQRYKVCKSCASRDRNHTSSVRRKVESSFNMAKEEFNHAIDLNAKNKDAQESLINLDNFARKIGITLVSRTTTSTQKARFSNSSSKAAAESQGIAVFVGVVFLIIVIMVCAGSGGF